MKYRKVIAIGPVIRPNEVHATGQSMMFQLLADELQLRSISNKVIDIGPVFSTTSKRVTGHFSILRGLDYLVILWRALLTFTGNPKQLLYVTTAQSKVGFVRDYFIIRMAAIFKYRIVAHQFGANYIGFYNAQTHFIQHLIKKTLNRVDKIIVEGEFTKDQFKFLDNFSSKVIAITNGLPERNIQNGGGGKFFEADKPFELLYLSNLIISKGFWDVIKAVDILVNRFKLNIHCTFSGRFLSLEDDPPGATPENTRQSFFKFIEDNHLTGNVQYYPGLYGNEKAEAFKKAHVFLLPSYYINEGQPVSILEAMAYGVIPVVTKYRLIPSMVTEISGFFVPAKDPEKIAEIVSGLVRNPEEYSKFSKASFELYKSSFTADVYLEKLIRVFE